MFEELMFKLTNEDVLDSNIQGNTMTSHAFDDDLYEFVYMEDLVDKSGYQDKNLNQLASTTNNELEPIYGDCALVRTIYNTESGSLVNVSIDLQDICDLVMSNFYHTGVMIDISNTMLELIFSGDNPNMMIGNKFNKMEPINVFGLTLVGYVEENTSINEVNEIASTLYGKEIKARVFFTMLCPITNKKYCDITIKTIKRLLKILTFAETDMEKINNLNRELLDDKIKNPFFLIKKYSV